MIDDGVTLEERDGMKGTMTIDAEWGFLKNDLPKNCSARTPAMRSKLDILIRAQQFRRMVSTGDRWAAFCGLGAPALAWLDWVLVTALQTISVATRLPDGLTM